MVAEQMVVWAAQSHSFDLCLGFAETITCNSCNLLNSIMYQAPCQVILLYLIFATFLLHRYYLPHFSGEGIETQRSKLLKLRSGLFQCAKMVDV